MLEKIKTFLASPEGAAAIVGFLRALFTILIGVGVVVTQEQAESAIALATTLITLSNLLLSMVTVKAVAKRADTEEAEAALSGYVTETNKSDLIV
jgi:hypothetical protein